MSTVIHVSVLQLHNRLFKFIKIYKTTLLDYGLKMYSKTKSAARIVPTT